MSKFEPKRQLAAAREISGQYKEALSALAKTEKDAQESMTPEMRRQMEIARERMKKYEAAYRQLAK
jgi:hypothetical protein